MRKRKAGRREFEASVMNESPLAPIERRGVRGSTM